MQGAARPLHGEEICPLASVALLTWDTRWEARDRSPGLFASDGQSGLTFRSSLSLGPDHPLATISASARAPSYVPDRGISRARGPGSKSISSCLKMPLDRRGSSSLSLGHILLALAHILLAWVFFGYRICDIQQKGSGQRCRPEL